ncbi:hypothetical protein IQ235_14715 [Oscillatoriales cyanobacterium LEGE 11467]|uniref:Uncharacterized protein n=1 Tax=Zarconia navalis LEGE 11467 TaxID=1828826 RepID=A0A928W2J1_9CYAN|nr:hypothetical protein [Zarconia navalis]MBE9042030.1 hypothetical protein [Zarconia navalis LEGE 11467]
MSWPRCQLTQAVRPSIRPTPAMAIADTPVGTLDREYFLEVRLFSQN